MAPWLMCENGHRWRRKQGQERLRYVAMLLEQPPSEVAPEDIDMFGDDCPKCGRMGAPEVYRRIWR